MDRLKVPDEVSEAIEALCGPEAKEGGLYPSAERVVDWLEETGEAGQALLGMEMSRLSDGGLRTLLGTLCDEEFTVTDVGLIGGARFSLNSANKRVAQVAAIFLVMCVANGANMIERALRVAKLPHSGLIEGVLEMFYGRND